MNPTAVVADLGNSRLKWGLVRTNGLEASIALPIDDTQAWSAAWEDWALGDQPWIISTVNPPLAARLEAFLHARGVRRMHWFRSAADVPIKHALDHPERAGADRAFAVLAAVASQGLGRPGIVVSCGSAITVERISAEGIWLGGAIAPGLGLSARALNEGTAQLPFVNAREAPAAWGNSTQPALEAGIFWGAVGTIRELVMRQSEDLTPAPWLIWTGGDARILAPHVAWRESRVVPDLVLLGLQQVGATLV